MNGLIMSIEEFRTLPEKEKLDCLFQNQVKTLELIKGYKLYQKINMIVGSIIVGGLSTLWILFLNYIKGV